MKMNNAATASPFVQIANVLRDDCHLKMVLQFGQDTVGLVRLGSTSNKYRLMLSCHEVFYSYKPKNTRFYYLKDWLERPIKLLVSIRYKQPSFSVGFFQENGVIINIVYVD